MIALPQLSDSVMHHLRDSTRALEPKPDVVYRALGAGGVLVDLSTDTIFELNETGARIWSLIADGASQQQVVETLVAEFSIDASSAEAQVERYCAVLLEHGLLR